MGRGTGVSAAAPRGGVAMREPIVMNPAAPADFNYEEWKWQFSETDARLWASFKFDPEEACEYRDNGVDPETARDWRDAGFPPYMAIAWLDAGVTNPGTAQAREALDQTPW